MSVNYDKYKSMTPDQLQKAIDDGTVTRAYLGWLGVIGQGRALREIVKADRARDSKAELPTGDGQ